MNVLMFFCMNAGEQKNSKMKRKHHFSGLFIALCSFFILAVGFIPFVLYYLVVKRFFFSSGFWFYVSVPFLICFAIVILLLSQMFISGFLIKLFRLYYMPGMYHYEIGEKNALKWMIVASIYTPIRKILEIIPVGGLKNSYLRLVGMELGENTLVGGVIKDPCVTRVGHNTTVGEYAIIYGHIHNFKKGTILIDPVTIGHNCIVGAGAIVMPGAVIEDNVKVAAGALVTKKQRLRSGNTYVGIPANKL